MNKNLLKIFNHFGLEAQRRKLQEEILELEDSILDEENYIKYSNEVDGIIVAEKRRHIIEELSDCLVLLKQIQENYKISNEDITDVMEYKIKRTLSRIEDGYYENNI